MLKGRATTSAHGGWHKAGSRQKACLPRRSRPSWSAFQLARKTKDGSLSDFDIERT